MNLYNIYKSTKKTLSSFPYKATSASWKGAEVPRVNSQHCIHLKCTKELPR